MKNIIPDKYDEILSRLKSIEKLLQKDRKPRLNDLIDNSELLQMLKISPRTAQIWRNKGLIGWSKINGKLYYKASEIMQLHDKYYKKAKRK
jgi:hypothetical protein